MEKTERTEEKAQLQIVPISIKNANDFVKKWHRHNSPVKVARFACAVSDKKGEIRGVAIVGTPNARNLTDGFTVEILRVATDGTRNACSILYGACCRASKALGYRRVYTYTLHTESQSSLKASGFTLDSVSAGGSPWSTAKRKRKNQEISMVKKNRWVKIF
jgi:hypothetical protein